MKYTSNLQQELRGVLQKRVPFATAIEIKVEKIQNNTVIFSLVWRNGKKKIFEQELPPMEAGDSASYYEPNKPIEVKFT